MTGLAILTAFAVYLIISAVVINAVASWVKRTKASLWWPIFAGFVMFMIPFWDWLPTVAAHKYYCSTEAGFWVYKTLDQWKAENPGVMETLVETKGTPSAGGAYILNQRFKWAITKDGPLLFNRWRWEHRVVDIKNNEVLARYVDFSTGSGFIGGPPRQIKFWLQNDHCIGGASNQDLFRNFRDYFIGAKK